ncbi:MAG: ectoine synthase [Candidatus Hydrogenedentes bacterium]|nr:ectoine synthase [Candidatus Hydrogenedentota bacterium]
MIIRSVESTRGTAFEVHAPTWSSLRLLVKKDGMGFSLHVTTIVGGTETRMWYRNHLEAVYCLAGTGEIDDLGTGATHRIVPGTLYALNQHDKHVLRAHTDLRLLCVFNPPCVGNETHDEHGGYRLAGIAGEE